MRYPHGVSEVRARVLGRSEDFFFATFGKGLTSRVTDVYRQNFGLASRSTPGAAVHYRKKVAKELVPSSAGARSSRRPGSGRGIAGLSCSGAHGLARLSTWTCRSSSQLTGWYQRFSLLSP